MVSRRELYGPKSSIFKWSNHIYDGIGTQLGFLLFLVDPDLWIKLSAKTAGNQYYSYILVYVDNILIIENYPHNYIEIIEEKYTVKSSRVGEPKTYLRANIKRYII